MLLGERVDQTQSVLFIAIFYGISVIWERDLGILQKLLATPAPRSALVLGKALSTGVRGLAQGFIIYLLALALHIPLRFRVGSVAGVAVFIILGFALFFTSNAIYPLSIMPPWLRALAKANPLSCTEILSILFTQIQPGIDARSGLVYKVWKRGKSNLIRGSMGGPNETTDLGTLLAGA